MVDWNQSGLLIKDWRTCCRVGDVVSVMWQVHCPFANLSSPSVSHSPLCTNLSNSLWTSAFWNHPGILTLVAVPCFTDDLHVKEWAAFPASDSSMISPVSTLHGSTTQIDSNPQLYGRRSAGSGDGSNPQNSTSLPTATLAAPSGISPGQPSVPRKAVPFKINGKELNAIPFGDGTKRTWNNYFENSHPFGGRECGGGIRDSVYGNRWNHRRFG